MNRRSLLALLAIPVVLIGGASSALLGVCGPFTDISDAAFCPFVLELFTLGITTGTSPTTYDPASTVTRLQMAAFLSRTVDRAVQRESPRTALNRFWTTKNAEGLGLTTVGISPQLLDSDGTDLWVANFGSNSVSRVRASDGKLLESWTGAGSAGGVLSALNRIFVTGVQSPGKLYRIDPSESAGTVTTLSAGLGDFPLGIAFDGAKFWTANFGSSVSIVSPGGAVSTVTTGFTALRGVLFDGAFIWVTDQGAGKLLKLNSNGAILQIVTVGASPFFPVYDGSNIWVPNSNANSITVVRASTGAVLATLTGNGLIFPIQAAFDGQRVLVTNEGDILGSADGSVSLWNAANLTPIGSSPTGNSTLPLGARSDGINFWIVLSGANKLARF